MSNKFKEGDLVFELSFYSGITLTKLVAYKNDFYPLEGKNLIYTTNGFELEDASIPNLLHATPENREKLVAIWGEDAVPELPLRGSELTKKLLESQKFVVAWVSDISDAEARLFKGYVDVVNKFESDQFKAVSGEEHGFAVPVDPKTGEEVTGGDDE